MIPLLFTVLIILLVFSVIAFTSIPPEAALFGGLVALLGFGVIDLDAGLSGFSNPGIMTIGLLFIVIAGLQNSGVSAYLTRIVFPSNTRSTGALWRLMSVSATLSAFLNNTAVVAMLIPVVQEWTGRRQEAISKYLLPLSYATILGGAATLVGTSTNLVVSGLLREARPEQWSGGMHMFEMTSMGLISGAAGLLVLGLFSRRFLPVRFPFQAAVSETREHSIVMRVADNSPFVGKTIQGAGLRHLKHCYLAEISRSSEVFPAVASNTTIAGGDLLVFVGSPEAAVELRGIPGIVPAENSVFELELDNRSRQLVEAVVSTRFPYLYQTVRESGFRTRYGAAILSVSREGQRVSGKIGDIRLLPGDTLLLESGASFEAQYKNHRDFFLVSGLFNRGLPDHRKAPVAIGIVLSVIVLAATGLLPIFLAAALGAAAMIISGCIGFSRAVESIDFRLLVAIASSFALGEAIQVSGLGQHIAEGFTAFSLDGRWSLLALFALTVLVTEFTTNNAAAVILFPIALSVAAALSHSYLPYVMTVLFGASTSFLSPLGYTTNLMVYGPGGYTTLDYFKAGLPLTLSSCAACVAFIPVFWPF